MSFRNRLRLFFATIVIVPMAAVAIVLYILTTDSETGKADVRLADGLRSAFVVYEDGSRAAEADLRRVARDRVLAQAVERGEVERTRRILDDFARRDPRIRTIWFKGGGGAPIVQGGEPDSVASAGAPLALPGGRQLGSLAVSTTSADDYARRVARLTGLKVGIQRGGRTIAATAAGAEKLKTGSESFSVDGQDYRGRLDRVQEVVGPPVGIAVYDEEKELTGSLASSRLLIGGILLAFLLLALASSIFVVRALQGQIGQFLDAAQRLAKGDFKKPVPTHGSDEFALLGREFNSMSQQLEAKIDEVERKRQELEETIRRVGDAFASGLDPQGVIELTVDTALDACEAESGRALPLIDGRIAATQSGSEDATLVAALGAAERQALQAGEAEPGQENGAYEGRADRAHALAVPIPARHGQPGNVGLVSIARRGEPFAARERKLLEYLAGQAAVSIENADLHEAVQRQAVTDELTGLSNVRELHTTLDREIERSRRFTSPLALVMVDIDNFKQVNDEFGHQQGDEVLVEVARALKRLSRDIDEPARYGGEELAVIAPQTDAEGAAQLAERMREAIEDLRIARLDGLGHLGITASFGVAALPGSASDKPSLIAAADAALYRAKRAGKNRVERAGSLTAPR